MAFCTACGAAITNSSKFCTGCGAPVPEAAVAANTSSPVAPAYAAPPPQQGSGVKVLLTILAVIVGLCIIGGATATFFAWKFAKSVKVQESTGGATTVKTPFGTITADDPVATARELGIDVYPGATPLKGAATVNFAGLKVASARFETGDTPDTVLEFYKKRYPNASLRVVNEQNRTLTFGGSNGMLAVHVRNRGDGTLIEMSRVGSPGASDEAKEDADQ